MPTLDPELLKFATPAELQAYEEELIREAALLSPMDYALHTTEGRVKAYPHTELMSCYAKALTEHALYDGGIGLPAVYSAEEGRWMHPTTGEEPHNILVLSIPPQHGKAGECTKDILTTRGWTTHGELTTDDYVFHPSGHPIRVLAVHPPVDDEMMRVEFFDGSHVDCHPNHEWTLYKRGPNRYTTIETKDLVGTYERATYSLPHRAPLQMPEADLLVDPYFLGVWLGDGTSSKATICGEANDLRHILSNIKEPRGFRAVHKTTKVHYQGFRQTQSRLRDLGVLNNKHIPREYLLASEAQRRALLAGLVDTDGHWSESGKQFVITSASKRLAEGIATLVRSLGYRAGLVERKDGRKGRAIKSDGICYAVTYTPHDGLGGGYLPRKRGGHRGLRRRIGIKAVYPVPPKPMNCITVDSPDGLYLIGKELIPTHNSMAVTETVPAWWLSKNPDGRVIVAGYESEFAKGFGRANRDKIEGSPELGVNVSRDTRAADNWTIEGHSGGLVTAGAGGPISGKRMDLMIIDDPVKNQDDALSETSRRRNKNWWESVVKARMRNDSVIIVIQTRWHEDDLAGHIVNNERCYELNIPAIAFEEYVDPETGISLDPDTGKPDPLGRKPGEALCPEIQSKAMLERKRDRGDETDGEPGGMLWFSALYQGKPNIQGGGIFPRPFRYYDIKETHNGRKYYHLKNPQTYGWKYNVDEVIYFITADLATSVRQTADYTVFSLFAYTPDGRLILVDMYRNRIEGPHHASEAEKFWNRARGLAGGAGVRYFGIENITFGQSLLQTLKVEARIPVKPLFPDKDKVARAILAGSWIQADRLFIPRGMEDLEKEMQSFPNGKHDDMVDTLAYGVSEAMLLPRRTDPSEQGVSREEAYHKRKNKARNPLHDVVGYLP